MVTLHGSQEFLERLCGLIARAGTIDSENNNNVNHNAAAHWPGTNNNNSDSKLNKPLPLLTKFLNDGIDLVSDVATLIEARKEDEAAKLKAKTDLNAGTTAPTGHGGPVGFDVENCNSSKCSVYPPRSPEVTTSIKG